MQAIRKIIINMEEVQAVHNLNAELEYSGDNRFINKRPIPEFRFREVEFNFKANNVVSYFIDHNSKDKDIVVNFLYQGDIRFIYNAVLESQLSTIMSLGN